MSKRPTHLIAWLLCTLTVTIIISEGALQLTDLETRRRAEELLNTVRQWQLGKTAFAETLPVRVAYEANRDIGSPNGSVPEQRHTIIVRNRYVNALALKFPLLSRLGVRPSAIVADLQFRDEKLSYFRFSFSSVDLSESGRPRELTTETRLQESSEFLQNQ
jgi:hypothetical protein